MADVTRRRLEALIAELAESRGETPAPPRPDPVPAPALAPEVAPSRGRHARRPVAAQRRLGGWIADRLPASLQGRAHLGAAQFGLVALVVAVGLVLGAWWLVRAGGSSGGAGEVAPPRPTVAVATPDAAVPSTGGPSQSSPDGTAVAAGGAAPSSAEEIVVDVVGKVRRPGIAVLPVGARVVDAVRAAGGMLRGVDPASVNLARPLTDGEQVVVGLAGSTTAAQPSPPIVSGTGTAGALVNLNTADQAALETLPGVGPVTAAAILEWRSQHGGFTSVDELLEVSGIGEATLAEIAPHVTL